MNYVFKKIFRFFDKLEDHVRIALSHYPIVYTIIGGFSIVLFWRGVWMTADYFPFLTGPISIIISVSILLVTGLFVSFFITDRIILTGIKQEKKLAEKTETEVAQEESAVFSALTHIKSIEKSLAELSAKVDALKK